MASLESNSLALFFSVFFFFLLAFFYLTHIVVLPPDKTMNKNDNGKRALEN